MLCKAFALALAQEGAKVAILDLNEDKAREAAQEINDNNGTAIAVKTNVLDKESIKSAQEEIHKQLGTCDILINGAGGNHPKGTTSKEHLFKSDLANKDEEFKTFFDLDAKGIEFVFQLNFLGTFLPTQVFAKDLIDKPEACIINVSSMNAFTPLTKIPAYSAAKASVSNFTQWLAVHFAKVGIRVNALAPGFFLTDQNRSLLTNSDGSFTQRAKTILEHTPMGRFGEPEDLVGTLFWLCSNDSRFVTGVTVPIDGGFNAFSGV